MNKQTDITRKFVDFQSNRKGKISKNEIQEKFMK